MKNHINYNGNKHSIVEGIELYEMSNGNVSHTLDENDDHFRFTVTGTNHGTGIRRSFRFLLNANIKRGLRGTLDVVYVLGLIEETVTDALAAENCFVTGKVTRGEQFDRAFARHILSPNAAVSCLPGGRLLCFDGLHQGFRAKSTDNQAINDALLKAVESKRQFMIVAGQVVYTYSVEDAPKWGADIFAPAALKDGFNDNHYEAILNHFSKLNNGEFAKLPLCLMMVGEEGGIRRVAERKSQTESRAKQQTAAVVAPARKPHPAKRQPERVTRAPSGDQEYAAALLRNDQAMNGGQALRMPWRTNTGAVQPVAG